MRFIIAPIKQNAHYSKIGVKWCLAVSKLNPYVANRVFKIQKATSNFKWLYIRSDNNPADCLSRGIGPEDIVSNELRIHGPSMLSHLHFCYAELPFKILDSVPAQRVIHFVKTEFNSFFGYFSSIIRLQRIVSKF
ncbi:hypothetical protein HUJ04_011380 [Dendroctonus ponderosae]|nr:hypothetical protein HUJ04_011380 [Dendroctonus ponderosae]